MVGNLLKDPKTWYAIVTFLFGVLVTGPVGNRIWDWPRIWPWTLIALICAIGVAQWRRSEAQAQERIAARTRAPQEREQQLETYRSQFALCKPVLDLRPEDFSFQFLDPGEDPDRDRRPFYQRYVPRRIVPLESIGASHHNRTFTESSLTDELEASGRIVILGQPTMGKSRTLYEVVKSLRDWVVICPSKDRPPPSVEALEALVTDQYVVLVLEDLNDFASGSAPDLGALREAIRRARAAGLAIAATCRDGSELSVVGEAVDSSLRRFYDDIPLKVVLLSQTSEEKGEVAASAGKTDWDPADANRYPTPGAIVMEEALRYQRGRFQLLSGDQKDALRSLQLLTAAGVIPLTHSRLSTVLTHVFHRRAPHVGEMLDALTSDSFLRRPARQDPIHPEPAYLDESVVSYLDGRDPSDDFPALRQALVESQDTAGLFFHAATYVVDSNPPRFAEALAVLDRSLELRPDDPNTLTFKGTMLDLLGDPSGALTALNRSLESQPDDPDTLSFKGKVLNQLGDLAGALTVLDRSLKQRPENPTALSLKGAVLRQLGEYAEALKVLDRSLELHPDDPRTLTDKGTVLRQLGEYAEALKVLDRSLELHPDDPYILTIKGTVLIKRGNWLGALEALDRSLEFRPENSNTLSLRGAVLDQLGEYAEALKVVDQSLELHPDDPSTLTLKGIVLDQLGEYAEALKALDQSLELRPNDPSTLTLRTIVIGKLS